MHTYLWKKLYSSKHSSCRNSSNNTNKKAIFKNCAPLTDCITEINKTQVDDAQKIDIVMPMYNLIFWQYYRDEPALDDNDNIIDVPATNSDSKSFKFKQQITGQTGNGDTIVK